MLCLLGTLPYIATSDFDGTIGRRKHASQHAERGGLSGTIGADKTEYFAGLYLEGEAIYSQEVTETLGEIRNYDSGFG
jgi:hypothetical protein